MLEIDLQTQEAIQDAYSDIRSIGRTLSDLERTRIGLENRFYATLLTRLGDDCPGRDSTEFFARCRSAYRDKLRDTDGNVLIDEDTLQPIDLPEEGAYEYIVKAEKSAIKTLESMMLSLMGPNMQAFLDQVGIGTKTVSRLLGEIGHPVVAFPAHWEDGEEDEDKKVLVPDEPFLRRVSDLWSYCGHGDPSRKRRKGMTQEEALKLGNPTAKMTINQMAVRCMMRKGSVTSTGKVLAPSPYRAIYDIKRAHYETARPEWPDAHKKGAAIRITAKEILRDLYNAALKDLEEAA